MSADLYITIGIVLGLAVGILIDRNARRERDEEIKRLNNELDRLCQRDTERRI